MWHHNLPTVQGDSLQGPPARSGNAPTSLIYCCLLTTSSHRLLQTGISWSPISSHLNSSHLILQQERCLIICLVSRMVSHNLNLSASHILNCALEALTCPHIPSHALPPGLVASHYPKPASRRTQDAVLTTKTGSLGLYVSECCLLIYTHNVLCFPTYPR